MGMVSLNISLQDPLNAYLEERVGSGEFGTPSEFIRNLIREDREHRRSRIEAEILEALQSQEFTISQEELESRAGGFLSENCH